MGSGNDIIYANYGKNTIDASDGDDVMSQNMEVIL